MLKKKKTLLGMLLLPMMFLLVPNSYAYLLKPNSIVIDIGTKPNTSSSSPSTTTPVSNIKRYYFHDQPWWNTSNANPKMYLWSSTTGASSEEYPGILMTWKREYTDATDGFKKVWYRDVDISIYDYAIITRWDSSGSDYWGSKTQNILLTDAFNTIYLPREATWTGNNKDTPRVSISTAMFNEN